MKLEIPKVIGVGFDIENFEVDNNIDSRRTTLYDIFLQRDIFFADNLIDDGNRFRDGVKIRKADGLKYTLTITDVAY